MNAAEAREERHTARLLLSRENVGYLKRVSLYYRLVRFSGRSPFIALRKALFWA